MNRKTIAICSALAAFAIFAIAPATSWGAFLTETVGGKPAKVEKGKQVVAYNEQGTSVKLASEAFTVECNEVTMTGAVHGNHDFAGNVHVTIEDVWFRGDASETRCTDNNTPASVLIPEITNEGGKQHWCIKNPFNTDEFLLEPRNCTEGAGGEFKFTIVTTGITCGFKRAEPLKGTVTTGDVENKPVTFKMNAGQEFKTNGVGGHSVFCPATAKLENFLFEMYTDTAVTGPAYRDAASVADPVYLE
jgi:hypothetical protein